MFAELSSGISSASAPQPSPRSLLRSMSMIGPRPRCPFSLASLYPGAGGGASADWTAAAAGHELLGKGAGVDWREQKNGQGRVTDPAHPIPFPRKEFVDGVPIHRSGVMPARAVAVKSNPHAPH